jgi:heme/copper-type cytochrome/quinol oxidase subunit 2
MEPNKNKSMNAMWIILVVVVLVIVVFFMMRARDNKALNGDDNLGDFNKVEVEGTEDVDPVVTPVVTSAPANLTYQQALINYKDRRIQFNSDCQATPSNVTYKNGTSIMIDNRSAIARTLNINGAVSVKAWGFKIVKLSSSTLPKTILVDCGNGQNVATILLQK